MSCAGAPACRPVAALKDASSGQEDHQTVRGTILRFMGGKESFSRQWLGTRPWREGGVRAVEGRPAGRTEYTSMRRRAADGVAWWWCQVGKCSGASGA